MNKKPIHQLVANMLLHVLGREQLKQNIKRIVLEKYKIVPLFRGAKVKNTVLKQYVLEELRILNGKQIRDLIYLCCYELGAVKINNGGVYLMGGMEER